MRKRVSRPTRRKPAKTQEPLAEGIIPLDARGRRNWTKMSDMELVALARTIIREKAIQNRTGLRREDGGLHNALWKRGLLEQIGFSKEQKRRRNWASMEDEELIVYCRALIRKKKVRTRSGLANEDCGLYHTLRRRGILERMGFDSPRKKSRAWVSKSDEEIVALARAIIRERGLKGRWELAGEDSGLYTALHKRKLMDKVGMLPPPKTTEWASRSDGEIVALAREVIRDRRINGRRELMKEDSALYDALRRRGLLGEVKLKRKQMDWASMSNGELVALACASLEESGVRSRSGLVKEDNKLYDVLRRRELLDAVFSDIDSSGRQEAITQVVDGLKEFGDAR